LYVENAVSTAHLLPYTLSTHPPHLYTLTPPNVVNITFSQALTLLRPGWKWVIIGSVTPIMIEYGSDAGLRLLRTLTAKARLSGTSLWASHNSTAFPSQITSLVQDCFEGVVELALEERKGMLNRLLRVTYMEGRMVSGKWHKLNIHHTIH
jgi:hypothetical protein